jgi:hypothetical protein
VIRYLFGSAGFLVAELRVLVDVASPIDDFGLNGCSLLIDAGTKFALGNSRTAQ